MTKIYRNIYRCMSWCWCTTYLTLQWLMVIIWQWACWEELLVVCLLVLFITFKFIVQNSSLPINCTAAAYWYIESRRPYWYTSNMYLYSHFNHASTGPHDLSVNITKSLSSSSSVVVQWDEVDDSLPTNYTITWTSSDGTNSMQSHTLIEQSSYTITD